MANPYGRPSTVDGGSVRPRTNLNERVQPKFAFDLTNCGCSDPQFINEVKLATVVFQGTLQTAMQEYAESVVKAAGARLRAKDEQIDRLTAALETAKFALRATEDMIPERKDSAPAQPEFLPPITEESPQTSSPAQKSARSVTIERPHTTDGVNLRREPVEAPPSTPKQRLLRGGTKEFGWTRTCKFTAGSALIEMKAMARGFDDTDNLNEYLEFIAQRLPQVDPLFDTGELANRQMEVCDIVDVSSNRFRNNGCERLIDFLLEKRISARILAMDENDLYSSKEGESGAIDKIIHYIKECDPPVRELRIQRNQLSKKGIEKILRCIIDCGKYPILETSDGTYRPFWLYAEGNPIPRGVNYSHLFGRPNDSEEVQLMQGKLKVLTEEGEGENSFPFALFL